MERVVRPPWKPSAAMTMCCHRAYRVLECVSSPRRYGGAEGAYSQRHQAREIVPGPFDMNRRADWQTRYAYYPRVPKPVIGMLNVPHAAHWARGTLLYWRLAFAPTIRSLRRGFTPRADCRAMSAAWMLPAHCRSCQRADLLMSPGGSRATMRCVFGFSSTRCIRPTTARALILPRDLADFVVPSAIAVIKRQLYRCAVPDHGRSHHLRPTGNGNRAGAGSEFSRERALPASLKSAAHWIGWYFNLSVVVRSCQARSNPSA